MTALSIQFGWLAVRVTVIALIAAVLARWSARRAARSAVIVLSAAMAIFLALSVIAFCPLPDGCRWSLVTSESVSEPIAEADDPAPVAPDNSAPANGFELAKALSLVQKLSAAALQSDVWHQGSAILLTLYGFGVAMIALRLLSGWVAIRALMRCSQPITDIGLLELIDSLRGILDCSRRVELRECREPGLAATVGWWRPVIFIPPEWPDWTPSELRTVLAHELSHIRNGDYLVSLVTRLCQAVHYYHPLIHWLSAQVRWQQELAADELAASVLADRNQYLKALASLALRSPARMSARAMPWSAMTGGTLLRRIHMLRGTQTGRPLGWAMRGLLVGVLAAIGVLLTTLGSPATPPDRLAENPDAFEIGYLSPDVNAFVALRPAFLLRQPGMEKAIRTMADGLLELKKLGLTVPEALKPENIEELVMDLHFTSKGTGKPQSRSLMVASSSLYLRLNQDFDWPAFLKSLSKEAGALTGKAGFEVTEIRDEGMTLYRTGAIPLVSPAPIYFYMPDRRSVVFSGFLRTAGDPQTDVKAFRQLIENAATARQRNWGGYAKVALAPIAAVVDNQDQHYTKMLSKDLQPTELKMLENIRFATVGIEVGEGRPVRLILDAKSAANAVELQKAADVVVRSLREKIRQGKSDDEHDKIALKLATELLQDHKLNREGARLEWVGFSSVRIHDLLERHDEKAPGERTKSRPE